MQKRWKVILYPCVLIAGLFCASPAAAGTIEFTDGWGVPDEDLSAILAQLNEWSLSQWFIALEPANQWTSAANLATMDSWITIVDELSGIDPSLLSELYGLGMIGPSTQEAGVSNTPEPVLMGFLGVALLALGFYGAKRTRRMRQGGEARAQPGAQSLAQPRAQVVTIDRDLQGTLRG
jgi:hypothetical protein